MILLPIYKIIHFSVHFSAIVNIFIVKAYLISTSTNGLKRKYKISKNVHSCRLSLFNIQIFLVFRSEDRSLF